MSVDEDTRPPRAVVDGIDSIISADDHLMEAPTIWRDRLPSKYREVGPRVERTRGRVNNVGGRAGWKFEELDESAAGGRWCDVWRYEDRIVPIYGQTALAGGDQADYGFNPITFDDMRPGTYEAKARVADMDLNRVEMSVCFPNTFVRFAGQVFLEAKDKDLALLGVRAYNDHVVDFSADTGGRVVPVGVIPLWDPELAAREVHRIAGRGCHVVVFTELPFKLGLPSLHTDHWIPFFRACEEAGTVIAMHTGSSSQFATTSDDAAPVTPSVMTFVNPMMSMTDWIMSGTLARHPKLRVMFSECEIGWLPYVIQRMDRAWNTHWAWGWGEGVNGKDVLPEPPSHYFRTQALCAFAEDAVGARAIEEIGVDHVAFEVDFPHSGGTWPHSYDAAMQMLRHGDAEMKRKVLRDNAINFLNLNVPTRAV